MCSKMFFITFRAAMQALWLRGGPYHSHGGKSRRAIEAVAKARNSGKL